MTCHCNDTTTFICPDGNCSVPSNGNGCGCGCNYPPDSPLPETHRVNRLIAPSRGTHTYWTDKDPVIFEGVIGLTKDRLFPGSLEYFIGDGTHKYSELPKYGGAEASVLKKKNTLVLRDENGLIDPDSIPASVTTKANNVVKADSNGSLAGWREAISNAVADPDNGLIVGSDGKLNVDFDQMPTNKFEALLKSLKMLIPLSADMDIYVATADENAGDTIIDGRGTLAKPFKTIQAAVNYVTSTYSIGSYTVTIYIGAGTYSENVRLPYYARTSGSIVLRTTSGARDVIVDSNIAASGYRNTCFYVSGGVWHIYRLHALRVENPYLQNFGVVARCFSVANPGSVLYLYGCIAEQKLPSFDMSNSNGFSVRIIDSDVGGELHIMHDIYPMEIKAESNSNNAPNVYCINCSRTATIYLHREDDTASEPNKTSEVLCSGNCRTFYVGEGRSILNTIGGSGTLLNFTGTVTGKCYALTNGASVAGLSGNENYFPGNTAGTVESDSYCFYK